MRIGILSMQRVVNFGSVLQAYSLRALIQKACNPEEIRFIDIDRSRSVECNRIVGEDVDYQLTADMSYNILQRGKRRAFGELCKYNTRLIKDFMSNELGLSKLSNELQFDSVVVGSDEVFNTSLGISLQLYGEIPQANDVISYAASCGSARIDEIPQESVDVVAAAMANFSRMSVRDEGTREYVSHLYGGDVERHLDPVLTGYLRDRHPSSVGLKNYMVVYAYGYRIRTNEEIVPIKSYAESHNLKTLAIGGVQYWCDRYYPMGPMRVLDYFASADCIVTDTFHGVIFSVITHRNFAVLIRESNRNKLSSLLTDLGLEDRVVSDANDLEHVLGRPIDYDRVDDILDRERERSLAYLSEALCAAKSSNA